MEFNYVLKYTLIHDTVHFYSISYSYTPYQLLYELNQYLMLQKFLAHQARYIKH